MSLGVGQYQHDLPASVLEREVDAAVQDAVNAVGVDVNTASAALLRHVSGLNAARGVLSRRLSRPWLCSHTASLHPAIHIPRDSASHRDASPRARAVQVPTGAANSARDWREGVPASGGFPAHLPSRWWCECRYVHSAVVCSSNAAVHPYSPATRAAGGESEPLDATRVHPESYPIARALAAEAGVALRKVRKRADPASTSDSLCLDRCGAGSGSCSMPATGTQPQSRPSGPWMWMRLR